MTTREPGARLVFTQGFTVRPFSTAFFARSPAPSITLGFEVFVQEVIAAITTRPWSMPSSETGAPLPPRSASAFVQASFASANATRSCGRLGPAMLGTTEPRSSSSVSEYVASGLSAVWNMPCSLAYASTRATCSSLRPVSRR